MKKQIFCITVNGIEHKCHGAIITNAAHYAGDYVVAHDAHLSQGIFEVLLLQRAGLLASTRYGISMLRGHLSRRRDVKVLTGANIEIQAGNVQPVQVDGDAAGHLPVNITIDALRPRLMVPRAYAENT